MLQEIKLSGGAPTSPPTPIGERISGTVSVNLGVLFPVAMVVVMVQLLLL
jgi:hypothetical protein